MKRNIWVSILLTIVTCGLYSMYWMVVLTDEINGLNSDENAMSGLIALLLTIVTCGIYGYFWAYKMGDKVTTMRATYGLSSQSDLNILYLVLELFGFQIVNLGLIQHQINTVLND